MIWLVFALLTFAAAMSVLAPLARSRKAGPLAVSQRATDVAFYEGEVAAIARDVERGLMLPADAEAAKAEAARRLIGAAVDPVEAGASRRNRTLAALVSLALIFATGLGLYLHIGSPALRDQPLTARRQAPPEQMDVMAAVAKIEAHLAANPNDGRGYDVVAPVYMQVGRYADAARALAQANKLLGATPEREAAQAEAHMMAGQGKMIPEARQAIARALALQPDFAQARFYVGLAAEEDGNLAQAREVWTKLLADAQPGAPWADVVRGRLSRLGAAPPGPSTAGALTGPPSGDAAAAISSMPEADRSAAIRGMVDGLAARLASDGRDAEGWLRLVRAYVVLNEGGKAKGALADARRALAGDVSAIERLAALAKQLGLEG
jgi:cytochrome c-type biogenesis protein CcmH